MNLTDLFPVTQVQSHPVSILQLESHPSPLLILPSSHSSNHQSAHLAVGQEPVQSDKYLYLNNIISFREKISWIFY